MWGSKTSSPDSLVNSLGEVGDKVWRSRSWDNLESCRGAISMTPSLSVSLAVGWSTLLLSAQVEIRFRSPGSFAVGGFPRCVTFNSALRRCFHWELWLGRPASRFSSDIFSRSSILDVRGTLTYLYLNTCPNNLQVQQSREELEEYRQRIDQMSMHSAARWSLRWFLNLDIGIPPWI